MSVNSLTMRGLTLSILSSVGLVLFTSFDHILYYRILKTFTSYIWLFEAVIVPIGGLVFMIPILVISKLYRKGGSKTTIPQKHIAFISLMVTLHNVTSALLIPFISPLTVNLLGKITLPLAMIWSYWFLHRRYIWTHYLGAGIVLCSMAIQVYPSLLFKSSKEDSFTYIFIPLYLLSWIFNTIAVVYQEKVVKQYTTCSIWSLNANMALWRILFGLITIPLAFIHLPSSHSNIHLLNLKSYLLNGFICFFTGSDNLHLLGNSCHMVFFLFVFCIYCNICRTQCYLILSRSHSSVAAFVSSALRLPLVQIMLIWKWLAGPVYVNSTCVNDWISLFGVMLGIILYYYKPEISTFDTKYFEILVNDDEEESFQLDYKVSNPFIKDYS